MPHVVFQTETVIPNNFSKRDKETRLKRHARTTCQGASFNVQLDYNIYIYMSASAGLRRPRQTMSDSHGLAVLLWSSMTDSHAASQNEPLSPRSPCASQATQESLEEF